MGEIVTQLNDLNNSFKIDLTSQANGIYYVEIRIDSDMIVVKKISLIR